MQYIRNIYLNHLLRNKSQTFYNQLCIDLYNISFCVTGGFSHIYNIQYLRLWF